MAWQSTWHFKTNLLVINEDVSINWHDPTEQNVVNAIEGLTQFLKDGGESENSNEYIEKLTQQFPEDEAS